MSQRSIELHERGVAAINARQIPEVLLAPGFRLENTSTAVTDKTYYGVDGVREWIHDFFEAFADGARYETEEVIADGDDYVVAVVRITGHGVRSGAPLTLRWVNVSWFHDGRGTRSVGYLSRHEALKAVGLQ
ncbi:MAG TPA: nuclear transport factor 2 family protein [Solirubrobacteraceae bacterium]|jgi:ketosteroid isomerase-like protein|nr:nuclear transport factor 2 family protein [Solirubrobacteraceae bacterium]